MKDSSSNCKVNRIRFVCTEYLYQIQDHPIPNQCLLKTLSDRKYDSSGSLETFAKRRSFMLKCVPKAFLNSYHGFPSRFQIKFREILINILETKLLASKALTVSHVVAKLVFWVTTTTRESAYKYPGMIPSSTCSCLATFLQLCSS